MGSQNANETKSTLGSFQTTSFKTRVAECGSLYEIEANANSMIQLEERHEAP